jgi:ribosome-binding protein aMBF1 (putative translation factor)
MQDWTPVILKKPKKPEHEPKPQISHEKKYTKQLENEEAKLNILSHDMRQNMISFRNERKMSREQLAKSVNENVSVIRDLETGKVVNTHGVLQKINKVLGTKLKY